MSAWLASGIYRWRRLLTALIIGGALLLSPRANITHIDNDITAWFAKDDPVYRDYERFQDEFGGSTTSDGMGCTGLLAGGSGSTGGGSIALGCGTSMYRSAAWRSRCVTSSSCVPVASTTSSNRWRSICSMMPMLSLPIV